MLNNANFCLTFQIMFKINSKPINYNIPFMKKTITLFTCALTFGLNAQTIVGTTPTNKVVILEEFTGVNCPNCPSGHQVATDLLTDYPGRVIVQAYHPSNSSFTTPGAGQPDFRRTYLDDFYQSSYIGSRFMPSALVNRREWGSPAEKNTSRTLWDQYAQTIMAETSPVNVGVVSVYDAQTNTITVDVEVYYTSDVSNGNTIYVHLLEDGIIADQSGSGGGPNYEHKHMFREHLNTSTWGDPITSSTTTGSLFTTQYTFDLNTAQDPIDITKAKVVAFVYDEVTEEVYSGAEFDADGSSASLDEIATAASVTIYPNPTSGAALVEVITAEAQDTELVITDIAGNLVSSESVSLTSGPNVLVVNENQELSKGIYIVRVGNTTERFVVQ